MRRRQMSQALAGLSPSSGCPYLVIPAFKRASFSSWVALYTDRALLVHIPTVDNASPRLKIKHSLKSYNRNSCHYKRGKFSFQEVLL